MAPSPKASLQLTSRDLLSVDKSLESSPLSSQPPPMEPMETVESACVSEMSVKRLLPSSTRPPPVRDMGLASNQLRTNSTPKTPLPSPDTSEPSPSSGISASEMTSTASISTAASTELRELRETLSSVSTSIAELKHTSRQSKAILDDLVKVQVLSSKSFNIYSGSTDKQSHSSREIFVAKSGYLRTALFGLVGLLRLVLLVLGDFVASLVTQANTQTPTPNTDLRPIQSTESILKENTLLLKQVMIAIQKNFEMIKKSEASTSTKQTVNQDKAAKPVSVPTLAPVQSTSKPLTRSGTPKRIP
ncbi:hypothetical protein MMC20_002025 [Loxospora ochrophaea]|nr:hypothetical protein [Loxospora ochrophaea]